MNENDFQEEISNQLEKFNLEKPELVFHWNDKYSNATGYLVINSLRGGAAGGGTRVHKDVSLDEITSLAKIMEIKFSLSGPYIGGAKSGISISHDDPNKYKILKRWYQAISPILKSYYGTGSDLNTDIHEINKILNSLSICHSQEGIINVVTKNNLIKYQNAMYNMRIIKNEIKISDNIFVKVAEMVTGYGVYESINSYFELIETDLIDKRVFIQGIGNVGASVAYYLNKNGAKVTLIEDKDFYIYNENGIPSNELEELLINRKIDSNNGIHKDETFNYNDILKNDNIDVFIPSASSNLVSKSMVDILMNKGLSIISCGANHPFKEKDHCYGDISQYIDKKIALIPDFLANMGMARTFHYLMTLEGEPTIDLLFEDIKKAIHKNIIQAFELQDGKLMMASLYSIALNKMNEVEILNNLEINHENKKKAALGVINL